MTSIEFLTPLVEARKATKTVSAVSFALQWQRHRVVSFESLANDPAITKVISYAAVLGKKVCISGHKITTNADVMAWLNAIKDTGMEMSRKTGIINVSLSAYRRGKTIMPLGALLKIAEAYSAPVTIE